MAENLENEEPSSIGIEDVWNMLLHRRWWILGSLFLCWSVAWTLSWKLPARYRSETLILVEQQKVPEEYVVSNVSTDLQQRLRTMTQQILSRTRLERIITDFNLYSAEQKRLAPDQLVSLMRKDIEIELVETPGKRDLNAFRVYYSAPTPELAQSVANRLTSLFIQENLLAQQQQSERTTEFLSSELDQARQSLELQEAKVREFKSRYLGQLPSQMQGNVEILTGLQNRFESLTGALSRSQQQKLYLESLIGQYRSAGVLSSSGTHAAVPATEELSRLRRELANARSKYTEQHPDVQRLKDQIAEAERRRQEQEAAAANADNGKMVAGSTDLQAMTPVLQLQSQLKVNEQEILDIQQQLKNVEQQIREYQGRLNMSPVREQQLADLTRDYEQSRENYDSLLKKQMQSQMATNLQRRQEGQQFRVLDPPSLPRKAIWPDRIKFSLGGLGAGFALGLLLAFVLEKAADFVRSEKQVKALMSKAGSAGMEIMSNRILATIPHVDAPGEERRRKLQHAFEWVAASVMLVAMAAGNAISFLRG